MYLRWLISARQRRINSYIVGCKFVSGNYNFCSYSRINSYIVGCKYIHSEEMEARKARINSYIVGCKSKRRTVKSEINRELIVT